MTVTGRVSDAERRQMVAEAAYFLAAQRGFDGGDPVADWLQAEAEVGARLAEGQGFADRLEERLATVNRKLKSARRKVTGAKSEAREEWQRDIDRLAELRDTLQQRFAELRRQGADAGEKTRQQLEKTWNDAADLLHRLERRLEKARG